jgi:SCL-interrupting locus protein N-terminus
MATTRVNVNSSNADHQIVHNYSLEMYKIHGLRVVPTTLAHDLLDGSNETPQFGLMCIDQARQLFLVPNFDAELPVIGLWIKDMKLDDGRAHGLVMRYIASTSIRKLSTGKQHLLILDFPADKPSSPACYECIYKVRFDLRSLETHLSSLWDASSWKLERCRSLRLGWTPLGRTH